MDEAGSQPQPFRDMAWMVCQYSRPSPVSSKKPETAAEAGGARGDSLVMGTITRVEGYWTAARSSRSAAAPLRSQKY
jgi:hypothetical protein